MMISILLLGSALPLNNKLRVVSVIYILPSLPVISANVCPPIESMATGVVLKVSIVKFSVFEVAVLPALSVIT